MVSTLNDDEDRVIGYIEYWQVGQSGRQKPFGEYVWIHYMWLHKSIKNDRAKFLSLVKRARNKTNGAQWFYFNREKYFGRYSKTYSIKEFIERLGG